jgi:hypothetical protein
VASLRRREALDDVGELVAVLLVTVADLVDETMGATSDVPAYARARVAGVHAQVIAQLREAVAVQADQSWAELLEAAATPPVVGG